MAFDLGNLSKIDLRKVWNNEAIDFTPWLAEEENLKLLGETVGLDLELEAKEKDVGHYRADILCKDTSDDTWVLIENQLERTNHTHLGQIITYAAGLNAVTIIWIASSFTDEHQASIEWLNEVTGDEIRFFGLEIELWRIGDSKIAPKFNIAAKPNEWTKGGGVTGMRQRAMTDTRKQQLQFWHGFKEYALAHAIRIKPTKPRPQSWMNISIGKSGFRLEAIMAVKYLEQEHGGQGVRAQFAVTGEDAKKHFALIEDRRDEIENMLGPGLVWHNPDETKRCTIYKALRGNVEDESEHPQLFAWLTEELDRFHEKLGVIVRDVAAIVASGQADLE